MIKREAVYKGTSKWSFYLQGEAEQRQNALPTSVVIILIKSVEESRKSIQNASFGTFKAKIERLYSPQSIIEFPWRQLPFQLILKQNGATVHYRK